MNQGTKILSRFAPDYKLFQENMGQHIERQKLNIRAYNQALDWWTPKIHGVTFLNRMEFVDLFWGSNFSNARSKNVHSLEVRDILLSELRLNYQLVALSSFLIS